MGVNISVYIPIILILYFFILLIVIPRISDKISPSMRFTISAAFVIVVWFLISLWLMQTEKQFTTLQWLAGMLFICAILIFAFMLWSVFCWGYTISMLLCLAENNSVTSLQHWHSLYTLTDDIRRLTENRVQVLVWMHCVAFQGEIVRLTRFGYILSNLFEKTFYYVRIK